MGKVGSNMGSGGKGRKNINTMLLILIGFCILAIIEIIYGQAQIRVERDRLVLEEQNRQTVQELQEELQKLRDDAGVTTGQEEQTTVGSAEKPKKTSVKVVEQTSEQTAKQKPAEEKNTPVKEKDEKNYSMQIVILGDSIMDGDRTKSGAADIISEQLNAKVYNMSIGGTTAALLPTESADYDEWTSWGLLGVVNAILGNVKADLFNGFSTKEILETCDFSKTDYFIIEYGVNDFLTGEIPNSRYLENGDALAVRSDSTYTGALETAITKLRSNFPDAQILLVGPHYCQIFSGKTFVGDGYSLDYGYGPLINFARGAGYIAEQHKEDGVLFFNAFEDSGIDAETADDYLEDGVHMTPLGARVYAEKIASIIRKDYAPEE